jgi:hypothetical protein
MTRVFYFPATEDSVNELFVILPKDAINSERTNDIHVCLLAVFLFRFLILIPPFYNNLKSIIF